MVQQYFKKKPSKPRLNSEEVHIWSVSLAQESSKIDVLSQTLSEKELKRARRFKFKKDRMSFVIRHGILREILGSYLQAEASSIQFYDGKNGKPAVSKPERETEIQFNLSCNKDLAVYAFTKNQDVGVDLEYIRPIADIDRISQRILSKSENIIFQKLSPNSKAKAFFKMWIRKEAFVKATGEGLYRALNTFELPELFWQCITDDARVRNSIYEQVSGWYFLEFKPAPGYVAVFVVNALPNQHRFYRWEF